MSNIYIGKNNRIKRMLACNKSFWQMKKQPLEVLYNKAAQNDFAIFIGKHLC